jgi:hypothetical protein
MMPYPTGYGTCHHYVTHNMEVKLKNIKNISFIYSDSARCWMGKSVVNSIEVEFEIYEDRYIQSKIDWGYFKEFLDNLEKNDSLPRLIEKSKKLSLFLADAFFNGAFEGKKIIERYKMEFVGLSFQGKSNSHFTSSYSYSLWFNIVDKEDNYAYVDPYGAYIVDVEARFITGLRREQC